MLKPMHETLLKISTKSTALLSLFIFLAFSIAFLPSQSELAESYSQGSGSPDTSFFYTPNDLLLMAENYGEEGRDAYTHARFTFDLAFPLIYTFFLITNIGYLWKISDRKLTLLENVTIIPLLALLFDLLENSAAVWVFQSFPVPPTLIVVITPFLTFMKWIFVGASFLILVLQLGLHLFRKNRP